MNHSFSIFAKAVFLFFLVFAGTHLHGQQLVPTNQGLSQKESYLVSKKIKETEDFLAIHREGLLSVEKKQRLSAAKKISTADQVSEDVYVQILQEPIGPKDVTFAFQAFVWAIAERIPNPSYPKGPMWLVRKRNESQQKEKKPSNSNQAENIKTMREDTISSDWLDALASMDEKEWRVALKELSQKKGAVIPITLSHPSFSILRARMLLYVAVLQALGRFGSNGNTQMILPVIDFAFQYNEAFREECGRVLKAMGEYAVPTLVKIAFSSSKSNKRKNIFANEQLEQMDRQSPQKSLKNTLNLQLKVDLLRTYGEVLHREAVAHVLSYTNDPSALVRSSARNAWMRYVEGPEPPHPPSRHRKRAGGIIDSHATQDYATFRQLAIFFIKDLVLKKRIPIDSNLTLKQLSLELFRYYDNQKAHEFDRLFDKGTDERKAGRLKSAVDIYQWILSHQPIYPKNNEIAATFYEFGEKLAQEGERKHDQTLISQALGYLMKSALLAPRQPNIARLTARIHYLDGIQAKSLGGDGQSDFRLAVEADPSYEEAKRQLYQTK